MPNKEVKTEVAKKEDVSPAVVGTENTKAALEKQEKNKDKLAVDPTITQAETEKARKENADAMVAKLAAEAKVQEQTNQMSAETQLNAKDFRKGIVEESEDLKKAVKKDAEARGKVYAECPVTGVLIAK